MPTPSTGTVAGSTTLRHWSASSAKQDASCRRAGYYHSAWGGTGIARRSGSVALPLTFGQAFHTGIAGLRRAVALSGTPPDADMIATACATAHADLEPYLAEADEPSAREATWCLEGMLRAFAKVILPEEVILFDMSRAIIEHKGWDTKSHNLVAIVDMAAPLREAGASRYQLPVGSWIYKEEKTTSANLSDARWFEGWEYDMQLVSGPRCLKAAHNIDVAATIVEGAMKGYQKWEAPEDGADAAAPAAAGRRVWHSPYTEGWRNGMGLHGEPMGWTWRRPKAYKGWTFTQTWEAYPTPEAFINAMSLDFLKGLFGQTRPLVIPDYIADEWIAQQGYRQKALTRLAEPTPPTEVLREHAPQNFAACTQWGSKCEFHALCWSTPPDTSPLQVGYVQREDPWAELLGGEEQEG